MKLSKEELLDILKECCNDVSFEYNGKPCGITPLVEDSIPTYHVWCGDEQFAFASAETTMKTRFFDGECLNDICELLEFDVC